MWCRRRVPRPGTDNRRARYRAASVDGHLEEAGEVVADVREVGGQFVYGLGVAEPERPARSLSRGPARIERESVVRAHPRSRRFKEDIIGLTKASRTEQQRLRAYAFDLAEPILVD